MSTLIVVLLGLAAGYLAACAFWPFAACRIRCAARGGTGDAGAPDQVVERLQEPVVNRDSRGESIPKLGHDTR
jgi:hypothetical protein